MWIVSATKEKRTDEEEFSSDPQGLSGEEGSEEGIMAEEKQVGGQRVRSREELTVSKTRKEMC